MTVNLRHYFLHKMFKLKNSVIKQFEVIIHGSSLSNFFLTKSCWKTLQNKTNYLDFVFILLFIYRVSIKQK